MTIFITPWLEHGLYDRRCYTFFCPHQPYGEVTLDDIRPYFQPLRYPIDGEFDSDTSLTLTISLNSDPSEPSHPSYHVETDLSEPSYPSMIRLTFDLSSSSAASRHVPPSVRGHRFIYTGAMPRGRGHAQGRGHGDDTLGGFGNGFLPPDKLCGDCIRSQARG